MYDMDYLSNFGVGSKDRATWRVGEGYVRL